MPEDYSLRAVVIGAGRRGSAHARAAVAAGARVAAVVDPDGTRAAALAAEVGGTAYTGLGPALRESANLALVTSPPPLHLEHTLAVLRAGCHVILEKPIALSLPAAREIGTAAAAAGKQVHVCQQQRYTRAAEEARSALRGRKVALAHVWLYRQAPDIRGNWDRNWGGGHVVEWAIHPIDFCRYVMGDVESVYAAYADQVLAGTPGWSNWDAYSCTLRFANGAVGSVATTYATWPGAGGGFGVDIIADGVMVRWGSGGLEVRTPEATRSYTEQEDPTTALHRAFYQALRTDDPSCLRQSYPDAVRTLATVLACNRSHETGQPVSVSEMEES